MEKGLSGRRRFSHMPMDPSEKHDEMVTIPNLNLSEEEAQLLEKQRLREEVSKLLAEEIKKCLVEVHEAEEAKGQKELQDSLQALYSSCSEEGTKEEAPHIIPEVVANDDHIVTQLRQEPEISVTIGKTHHVGARDNQQDSLGISNTSNPSIVDKKGIFAVVADGMGGLTYGSEVSVIVAVSMLRYFHERVFRQSLDLELLKMLYHANEEVNEFLGSKGIGQSGSTVVATIIKDNRLYWISVGDSHIYLYRDHALIQLNRDHNYGRILDERAAKNEISFDEARSNTMRHALTSFIGIGELTKVDRNEEPIKLLPNDRVILMSDGVYNTLNDEEIVQCMQGSPEESASLIETQIQNKNRPHQDNFTAIILECH